MARIVTRTRRTVAHGGRKTMPLVALCVVALAVAGALAVRTLPGRGRSDIQAVPSSGAEPGDNQISDSPRQGLSPPGDNSEVQTPTVEKSDSLLETIVEADRQTVVPTPSQAGRPKPIKAAVKVEKLFDNDVENQLELLSTPARSFKYPPKTSLTDEQIMQYLRRPVEIADDDDDRTIAAKERTAAMKQEALKFIENGGTYQEFVKEMVTVSNREADMLAEVRREKIRLLKEEGVEAAAAYLEEANVRLEEAGLRPVPITIMDTNTAAKAAARREATRSGL